VIAVSFIDVMAPLHEGHDIYIMKWNVAE